MAKPPSDIQAQPLEDGAKPALTARWRQASARPRTSKGRMSATAQKRTWSKAGTARYCGLPTPLIVAVAFSFADIRGNCEGQGDANAHKGDKAAVG